MKKSDSVKIQIAVNFDLIVKECKAEFDGSRSKAYDIIKKDLLSNGFYHDQGSGYISKLPMTKAEILDTLQAFFERNQWVDHCCKRLRVTQVGNELFDGTANQELVSAMRAMVNAKQSMVIPILSNAKESQNDVTLPPSFAEIAKQNKNYRPPQKPRSSGIDGNKKPPNKGSTGR